MKINYRRNISESNFDDKFVDKSVIGGLFLGTHNCEFLGTCESNALNWATCIVKLFFGHARNFKISIF